MMTCEQVAEILAKDYSAIYRRADAEAPVAADPQPGAFARFGDQAADPLAGVHGRIQRMAPEPAADDTAARRSSSSAITGRNGATTGASHFTVDRINGFLGHELKFEGQKLVGNYLRVGYDPDGSWRIYKLRPDFHPADKVQMEDDITASVVRTAASRCRTSTRRTPIRVSSWWRTASAMLFQRPDDAIHRGFDAQAEADIAEPGTFLSNFEPLTPRAGSGDRRHVARVRQVHGADEAAADGFRRRKTARSTSCPRRIREWWTASHRRIRGTCRSGRTGPIRARPISPRSARGSTAAIPPANRSCSRSAPSCRAPQQSAGSEGRHPPLAVYNPIHYQELPELFMEFICQPDGQVALHHRLRQRGRADEGAVQRAAGRSSTSTTRSCR